jgi:hypothetical protein
MQFRNSIAPDHGTTKEEKNIFTIPIRPRSKNSVGSRAVFPKMTISSPIPPSPSPPIHQPRFDRMSANIHSSYSRGRSASLQSVYLSTSAIGSAVAAEERSTGRQNVLVTHTFIPQMSDELQLDIGTSIVMIKEYDGMLNLI